MSRRHSPTPPEKSSNQRRSGTPSDNTAQRRHARKSTRKKEERTSQPLRFWPEATERVVIDEETGEKWYEYQRLTGRHILRLLSWSNGLILATCIIHAILFLPPYGLFYDGPARPDYYERHARQEAPHPTPSENSQSANSHTTSPDTPPSTPATPPSGVERAQSASDNPLFFDTKKDKDNTGGNGGDTGSSGDTGGGTQSAAPPSPTNRNIPLPQKPNTPRNLDESAAADLANYYASVLTYSARTGDTKPLEELFAPHCKECANITSGIRTLYDKGAWVEAISYSIKGEITTSRGPQQSGADPYWLVHIRLLSSQHTITDLQSRKTHPASETPTTLALCQHNNQWKICTIRQD